MENYRKRVDLNGVWNNNVTYDRTWAKQAMILQHYIICSIFGNLQTVKNCPLTWKIRQSRFKILPNTKLTLWNFDKVAKLRRIWPKCWWPRSFLFKESQLFTEKPNRSWRQLRINMTDTDLTVVSNRIPCSIPRCNREIVTQIEIELCF